MKTNNLGQLRGGGGYLAAAADFKRSKATYSLIQARTSFETLAEEAERILALLPRLPTIDVYARSRLKMRLRPIVSAIFRSRKMIPDVAKTPLLVGVMDRLTLPSVPTPLALPQGTEKNVGQE